jgi:hypothetical protein
MTKTQKKRGFLQKVFDHKPLKQRAIELITHLTILPKKGNIHE